MRRSFILVALAALAVVSAAQAATLDPSSLVLRRGDLQGVGWQPSANNGYRTVDQAAQGGPPGTAARFVKAGYVRGYDVTWGARSVLVGSTAYVFKTVKGAKNAFQVYRESGPPGTKRIAFKSFGDASLAFRSKQSPKFTAVVWRNGRVLSIVLSGGLPDYATLELVRIQSARVAGAVS